MAKLPYILTAPQSELNKMHLVVVAICTHKRPQMLKACLNSILTQDLPQNIIMHVAVIDNDKFGSGHISYIRATQRSGLMSTYLMESKRGIASARNRAIDFALEQDADYLCFVDDDETAHSDWLACLMRDEYLDIGILQGKHIKTVEHIPYENRPQTRPDKHEHGDLLDMAYTNNIRIHGNILKSGLRFDEQFNLTGGEDQDFTIRAKRAGAEIRYIKSAITWEPVHEERLTMRSSYDQILAVTCNRIRIKAKYEKISKLKYSISGMWHQSIGSCLVLLALLINAFSPRHSTRVGSRGMVKIARGSGQWSGVRGLAPEIYKDTVGQ